MDISDNYNKKCTSKKITHKNMDIKKLQQDMDISQNYQKKLIFQKITTTTNGYLKRLQQQQKWIFDQCWPIQ